MKKLLALFLGLFCLVGCGTESGTTTSETTTTNEVKNVSIKIADADGTLKEEKPFLVSEFLASLEYCQECVCSSWKEYFYLPNSTYIDYSKEPIEHFYVTWYDEEGNEVVKDIDRENIFYVYYDLGIEDVHYKTCYDGTNCYTFIGNYYTKPNRQN